MDVVPLQVFLSTPLFLILPEAFPWRIHRVLGVEREVLAMEPRGVVLENFLALHELVNDLLIVGNLLLLLVDSPLDIEGVFSLDLFHGLVDFPFALPLQGVVLRELEDLAFKFLEEIPFEVIEDLVVFLILLQPLLNAHRAQNRALSAQLLPLSRAKLVDIMLDALAVSPAEGVDFLLQEGDFPL